MLDCKQDIYYFLRQQESFEEKLSNPETNFCTTTFIPCGRSRIRSRCSKTHLVCIFNKTWYNCIEQSLAFAQTTFYDNLQIQRN